MEPYESSIEKAKELIDKVLLPIVTEAKAYAKKEMENEDNDLTEEQIGMLKEVIDRYDEVIYALVNDTGLSGEQWAVVLIALKDYEIHLCDYLNKTYSYLKDVVNPAVNDAIEKPENALTKLFEVLDKMP